MRGLIILQMLLASLTLGGCRSFSSTPLSRLAGGGYVGESNGEPRLHGNARPFKGVPITLKVPTHLDVYIDETYFVQLDCESEKRLLPSTQLFDVRTQVIKTDQVFIVDFKRPASGALDVTIDFDQQQQYFQKIVSSLEDETITDTANLISTVIQQFSALPASERDDDVQVATKLKEQDIARDKRVVGYRRFDLKSPTFEQDLEAFVSQYLAGCHWMVETSDPNWIGPQPVDVR